MIREIAREELPLCLTVIRRSFGMMAEAFGLTRENAPTNAAFMEPARLERDFDAGNVMLAAFTDAAPGMAGFAQLAARPEGVFELKNLAVLPERRHGGIGRSLVLDAAARAKALGGHKLSLGLIEENALLRDWYRSLGFVHTGVRRFGHLPFTVGFMELDL